MGAALPRIHAKELVVWSALLSFIIGGVFFAEDRYANAQETRSEMIQQGLSLQNQAEARANDNRLERMVRELSAVHTRNQSGAIYPGDRELIADLKEEIRIAREYRNALREQATGL